MWRRRRVGLVAYVLACMVIDAHAVAAGSISDEKELGRKFGLEARARLPLVDDVEIEQYVGRVGQQIVAALGEQPFTYQFFVVNDPRLNAFAVPGGYVYVHAGLLTRVSNDDELAGVLGHEIAHVNAHHLARQQERSVPLDVAALLGLALSVLHPAAGAVPLAAATAAQLAYRREFEQEADYLGAGYMRKAGYDPRGMLDFFKKLLDEQRVAPASAPPYLLSHPLTDRRLTNLEAVLRTHQWDSGPRRSTTLELQRVQLLARVRTAAAAEVIAFCRRPVEAQPSDGPARYLLGVAYLETGAFESARETFETAGQLGFHNTDRELGRTYLRLRQLEKAREYLSRATEVDPDDAVAWREFGKVLEALDDAAGAMRAYERALLLAPTCEEAHRGLGMLAGRAGQQGDGFYHLGRAFALRGEFDKALSQFEKAAPLLAPGSARATEVHAEIAELRDYLRHARSRSR